MTVEAQGAGWWRRLELRRSSTGVWSARTEVEGAHPSLPEPSGEMASLAGAFDCDLGFSPLTNLMPIRRSGLDRQPGAEDFLMAWISVPSLEVLASGQRYVHVGADEPGAVVRYVDQGLFPGYEANLQLDRLGLVVHYPGLVKRVAADSTRGRRSAPG